MEEFKKMIIGEAPTTYICDRCGKKFRRATKAEWTICKKYDRIYRGHYYDLYNLCTNCSVKMTLFMDGADVVEKEDTNE